MRRSGSRALIATLLGGGLGLLLSAAGCTREELAAPAAGSPEPQPALAAEKPASTITRPFARSPEQFRQAVARRFDATRITTRSIEGGVLQIPNGWAPHTMMMVRNPDGTVSQRCVSSSSEATALMNQSSAGDQR